jgi:predicted MFS family arabinose efflux permease
MWRDSWEWIRLCSSIREANHDQSAAMSTPTATLVSTQPRLRRSDSRWDEFRRHWRVLLVALLGMMTSVGTIPVYALGAFVRPLGAEFGWSRGAVQYALTAYFIGAIVASALCGWLLRRFSIRSVAIGSLCGAAVGFALLSQLQSSVWTLYAGMVALLILGAGTTTATWTFATNCCFVVNRGLALAIVLCGTGLCGMLAPIYVTALNEAFGWRAAFVGLGAPSLLLTLPAVMLLLPRELAPPVARAESSADVRRLASNGVDLSEALRSWRLWVMSIALMLVVVGIFGLVPNMVPILMDAGRTAQQAAALAGIIGVALVVSRLTSGYLIDRFWAPGVAAVLLSAPAFACAILLLDFDGRLALLLVVVLAGIGTGAENDIASFIVARYFGLRDYAAIFSAQTIVITTGSVIGPLMFGALYDRTGSYDSMLTICAVLFAAGATMLLTLGAYPRFEEQSAGTDSGAIDRSTGMPAWTD